MEYAIKHLRVDSRITCRSVPLLYDKFGSPRIDLICSRVLYNYLKETIFSEAVPLFVVYGIQAADFWCLRVALSELIQFGIFSNFSSRKNFCKVHYRIWITLPNKNLYLLSTKYWITVWNFLFSGKRRNVSVCTDYRSILNNGIIKSGAILSYLKTTAVCVKRKNLKPQRLTFFQILAIE